MAMLSNRAHGGTMVMWKECLDPYIKVHRVGTSSFLPIVFDPPDIPATIHIAVYLPTLGKESEFLAELSILDVCIKDLKDEYGNIQIYLRGDFNVSQTNYRRTSLLNHLCTSHGLTQVQVDHPTYHHFMGGGSSDSHLDRLLYPKSCQLPENLITILCRNKEPMIYSHHDLLVSEFSLASHLPQAHNCSAKPKPCTPIKNNLAPRVENTRTRVVWSDVGTQEYQSLVQPQLQAIQDLWLNPSSKSCMSLLLQATNDVMSCAAAQTNKVINLNNQPKTKLKKVPKAVRKSQRNVLKYKRIIRYHHGSATSLSDLKSKYTHIKQNHRKLERHYTAQESIDRDTKLYELLSSDPSKFFSRIKRQNKSSNAQSSIKKLKVGDKTFTGESVCDGFYDSISRLKSLDWNTLNKSSTLEQYFEDFRHILDICRSSSSEKIPPVSFSKAVKILDNLRPEVNDYYSITANHYKNAGPPGYRHFYLLMNAFIADLDSICISEINTVYACILFKGHGKDKHSDRSYRTISTCPLVAKGLDTYIRELNIDTWKADQADTQYQAEARSHELACLLLTECIQHSIYTARRPIYILYLDAKSAFDNVIYQILVRRLFLAGTTNQSLLYIKNRLFNRATYLDWGRKIMGPIADEKGVEQGGVNSDYYYKIFSKEQLTICQDSNMGVSVHGIVTSAIGQADDTALVSNSLTDLQNLLDLALSVCNRNQIVLCTNKTKLQVVSPPSFSSAVPSSTVTIEGTPIKFDEEAEHLGVIRSIHGNSPNLLNRFSKHKKALGGVLHAGLARHHRGNPAAAIRTEKVYGTPVLFSGLGSLYLKKSEIEQLDQHYCTVLSNLMHLLPGTPRAVIYFLAGSLPGQALLHLRQFSLFGMLMHQQGSHLYKTVEVILTNSKHSSCSWIHQLRDLCIQYSLPHPLTVMSHPPTSSQYKTLVKKRITDYWETILRSEADSTILSSLKYFQPHFYSLTKPHPLWLTAGASPYQVTKALVQAKMLSGRYRTERLMRHWSKNKDGNCLLPSCDGLSEDLEHILVTCKSLSVTRQSLASFTKDYAIRFPQIASIVQFYCSPTNPQFVQFLLDCSCLPDVIVTAQMFGEDILHHLFRITRTWCYSLHRSRLKLLGRWHHP